jgi:hypothetical protein
VLLIDRVVGWIPPFLETLDVYLCVVLGEHWWSQMDWNGPCG